MAVTKTKTNTTTKSASPARAAPAAALDASGNAEVLTLQEAAAFLRIGADEIQRLVVLQGLPGRKIGSEWRFLKAALQDWLRTPVPRPSKEALRSVIGSWKDDPELNDMLKDIYQQRGRPMTEVNG